MNISEIIVRLTELKEEHGDLPCMVTEHHEYWGTLYHNLDNTRIIVTEHAQPDGPKSGKEKKAVAFTDSL